MTSNRLLTSSVSPDTLDFGFCLLCLRGSKLTDDLCNRCHRVLRESLKKKYGKKDEYDDLWVDIGGEG